MGAAVFYVLAAVMVASAVMTITRRSAVHSAVFLVLSFLCLAGIFVILEAEFLAAVQVLVYAGGIMVLFLFVVMLVNLDRSDGPSRTWQAALGSLLVVGLVLLLMSTVGVPTLSPTLGCRQPQSNLVSRSLPREEFRVWKLRVMMHAVYDGIELDRSAPLLYASLMVDIYAQAVAFETLPRVLECQMDWLALLDSFL